MYNIVAENEVKFQDTEHHLGTGYRENKVRFCKSEKPTKAVISITVCLISFAVNNEDQQSTDKYSESVCQETKWMQKGTSKVFI